MFRPDERLDRIPATRAQLVSIIESINQPTVGVPGHAPQPVRAWVVGARRREGGFGLWVYLQLLESGEAVVYASDRGPLSVDAYPDAELEALSFVESMGFMVDNLNFRNLSEAQQAEIHARLPCFDRPQASTASREGGAADAGASLEARADVEGMDLDEAEVVEPTHDRPPLDDEDVERVGRILASF